MRVIFRRVVIFLLALIPLLWISYGAYILNLGADPAKKIVEFMGEWAMYFLLLTLMVTPLKLYVRAGTFNFKWLQAHRRMLGLFCLFYALLHVLAYFVFILGADITQFMVELVKRPYIVATIPALLLLIALGITSPQWMMRRLGKRWLQLHKSIYAIAILAWLHVFWQLRASYFDTVVFGILIFILLAVRVYYARTRR
jgi:sulfoxide reductase heme-binding subunit YedZ